jgi:centromere protein J
MTKLFPSLKQQQLQQLQQQQLEQQQKDREIFDKLKITQLKAVQEPKNVEINTNATLLKQKLTQLESEIERFQKKSLELSKLQEKCELELKSAESNRKMFEKQKEEEYSRLRDLHEEDVRKFKLEKKIFEQYKKSIKENPDRREREEMDRLKKQVR